MVIDLSFQLLHAVHSLEKLLRNFLDRKAVFDVVFWNRVFLPAPQRSCKSYHSLRQSAPDLCCRRVGAHLGIGVTCPNPARPSSPAQPQ